MPNAAFSPNRNGAFADDDEESSRLRTPQAAQYTTDAAGAAAALPQYPPLAETAGLPALVGRFKLLFHDKPNVFPTNVETFAHETVRSALKQHLREHGLQKESDYAAGGMLQPIIIQRPAFDSVVFFAETPAPDVSEDGTDWGVKLFSVPNKALGSVMARRGYKRVHVAHLPEDETRLPPAIAEITRASAAAAEAAVDPHPAPSSLKLPEKVVPIEKGGHAPTAAAQIVEQFELKVKSTQPNGTVVVYSPMRLWTKTARTQSKLASNQRQPFGVRCMIYYYIRTQMAGREPATISDSFDALRDACKPLKEAKEAGKSKKAKAAKKRSLAEAMEEAADEGEGAPEQVQALEGEWFDLALSVSKDFV